MPSAIISRVSSTGRTRTSASTSPSPASPSRPAASGRRGSSTPSWQLLEHIRLAQDDILQFCLDAQYAHDLAWPDDYWPKEPAPPDDQAWHDSIAACLRSRERLQQLARDAMDLTASVPTGKPAQTYLRAILLAADHVAYHVGQIVMVRKALGAWG